MAHSTKTRPNDIDLTGAAGMPSMHAALHKIPYIILNINLISGEGVEGRQTRGAAASQAKWAAGCTWPC